MFKLQDIDRYSQKTCYNYEMNKDLAFDYCKLLYELDNLQLDSVSLIIAFTDFTSSNKKIVNSFHELLNVSKNNTILTCSFQCEYENINFCIVIDFHLGIFRLIFKKNEEINNIDEFISIIDTVDDPNTNNQSNENNNNEFNYEFNIPEFNGFFGGY